MHLDPRRGLILSPVGQPPLPWTSSYSGAVANRAHTRPRTKIAGVVTPGPLVTPLFLVIQAYYDLHGCLSPRRT